LSAVLLRTTEMMRVEAVGDRVVGGFPREPRAVRALIPSLAPDDKARLDEAIRMILPVSSRRLGVLNEGNTQGSGCQYPLERITTPTLLISAADDLYKTLPVAV
jgi:hypothetical protein